MSIATLSDLARALPTNTERLRGSQNSAAVGNLVKASAPGTSSQAVSDITSFTQAVSLQSEMNSLRSASASIAQGSSLLQVADQGLGALQQGLTSLGSLIAQAQRNDLSEQDRISLQQRANAIVRDLRQIVDETKFANTPLLDGTLSQDNASAALPGAAKELGIELPDFGPKTLFDGKEIDLSSVGSAKQAEGLVLNAQQKVLKGFETIGAQLQRLDTTAAAVETAYQNQEAARSTLFPGDLLGVENNGPDLLSALRAQSGIAMLAQSNKLQPGALDWLNG